MNVRNYSLVFTVDATPEAVVAAIANVRGWWSEGIEGNAMKTGDRFTHRVLDLHRCDIAVKEVVPGRKVVWTVLDNHVSFTKDPTEWKNTDIVFEIASLMTIPKSDSPTWDWCRNTSATPSARTDGAPISTVCAS